MELYKEGPFIPYQTMLEYRNYPVEPIDIDIPHIFVPPELEFRKKISMKKDSIVFSVRMLLNSLTNDNTQIIREKMKSLAISQITNEDIMYEFIIELIQLFMISEQHIPNYLKVLNYIYAFKIPDLEKDTLDTIKYGGTIGNYFLKNCREILFSKISFPSIKKLAEMETDDLDQLDLYNKEREKIINLILTTCSLYCQNNSNLIHLNGTQFFSIASEINKYHEKIESDLEKLGNPYDGVCQDEETYFILEKMCTIYAEQFYYIILKCGKLLEDEKDQIVYKNKKMAIKDILPIVKKYFSDHLTEPFLISKYKSII